MMISISLSNDKGIKTSFLNFRKGHCWIRDAKETLVETNCLCYSGYILVLDRFLLWLIDDLWSIFISLFMTYSLLLLSTIVNLLYLIRAMFSSNVSITSPLLLELLEDEQCAKLRGVDASQIHWLFQLLWLIFCRIWTNTGIKNYQNWRCF
jgi:hypothetical protein